MSITSLATMNTAVPRIGVAVSPATANTVLTSFYDLWDGAAGGSLSGTTFTSADTSLHPCPGTDSYVTGFSVDDSAYGLSGSSMMLFDRLLQTSAFQMTTLGVTLNTSSLPRFSTGTDVQAFILISSPSSSAGSSDTFTVSYTNQAGTSGRTGTARSTNWAIADQLVGVTLQAGDTGVRSVQTVTGSATRAGSYFAVVLAKFLGHTVTQTGGEAFDGDRLAHGLITLSGSAAPFVAQFITSGGGAVTAPNVTLRVIT